LCVGAAAAVQSLNNLAVVLTSQGKAGEALSLLQAAISACPTYAGAIISEADTALPQAAKCFCNLLSKYSKWALLQEKKQRASHVQR
jgi:hypothetical protein